MATAIPMSQSRAARSSVATLPPAPGENGLPPKPPTELSRAGAPTRADCVTEGDLVGAGCAELGGECSDLFRRNRSVDGVAKGHRDGHRHPPPRLLRSRDEGARLRIAHCRGGTGVLPGVAVGGIGDAVDLVEVTGERPGEPAFVENESD